MDSINRDVEDVDNVFQRPEPSPEDKLVTAYLEGRSEVYRDLVKVQDDVWNNPHATAHFRRQRDRADKPRETDRKAFFVIMCGIGKEMNAASDGTLKLPLSNARVLDLCMAPGGYTASVLKHSPHAVVCAFTLPCNLGGHPILHRRDPRLRTEFGDITMLHAEFGVTVIPLDHPEYSKFDGRHLWHGKLFDLIFCDGQALRTHAPYIADYRQQVEAVRLTVSQLILAMQRIEDGGTLIILLHDVGCYESIKILNVFDKIAVIQLFKPTRSHKKRGTFYLIAKNVQPGHPKAVAAINEWKGIWKELTFPTVDRDGHEDLPKVASESELAGEVSNLLETFGERIIEVGEPIWHIQKEALLNATWTKKQKREKDSEHVNTDETSTATTDAAAVAVHDSEESVDDTGDTDEVDAAPVMKELPKPMPDNPADSADVSVAIERLDIKR